MTPGFTVEHDVHWQCRRRGRRQLRAGAKAAGGQHVGRIPRVAKFMALALRFEDLLRTGVVQDYADLAALGHVTRARITQIMNLLLLAPDIQEALLSLPRVTFGKGPIHLRHLQPIAAVADWRKQRRLWRRLSAEPSSCRPNRACLTN